MATLQKMLESTFSRGKKQRIKQKMQSLKRTTAPAKPSIEALATSVGLNAKKEVKTDSAKNKVEALLRKRDVKKQDKQRVKMSEEDKQLVRQAKNKKRAKKRDEAKEDDEFDQLFKQHKQTLLKKLQQQKGGPAFEEIEMSD